MSARWPPLDVGVVRRHGFFISSETLVGPAQIEVAVRVASLRCDSKVPGRRDVVLELGHDVAETVHRLGRAWASLQSAVEVGARTGVVVGGKLGASLLHVPVVAPYGGPAVDEGIAASGFGQSVILVVRGCGFRGFGRGRGLVRDLVRLLGLGLDRGLDRGWGRLLVPGFLLVLGRVLGLGARARN